MSTLTESEKLQAIYTLLKPPDADDDMDRYLVLYGMMMASSMYKANPVLAAHILSILHASPLINKEELSAIMQRINQL